MTHGKGRRAANPVHLLCTSPAQTPTHPPELLPFDAGFHADTGKRRQLLRQGFATKRAAQEALAEAVGASPRGMVASRSTIKLDE